MNFADMLSYADIQELNRIASNYDCTCNSHSKNELIQTILMTVGRKDVFERQVSNLSMEEIRFLNTLMFDARSSFSLEELLARVKLTRFQQAEEEDWNPRDTISRFKGLGWIFQGFSLQTKYLYQVPQDFRNRFNDVLAQKFREELVYLEDPVVYRDEQTLLVDDIDRFMRFVDQNNVLMTVEQFMYKKVLTQALEHMSVREEAVVKGAWRFGYGRKFKEYPNRFSLIYDYCFYNKLITEGEGVIALTPYGKSKLEKGTKENVLDVYRFWLRLYKGPIPNLQSLVHWINQLARNWVSLTSLSAVLCRLIRPYYYDGPESIMEQRILQMMMHLGLIAIGETHPTEGQIIRVTNLGLDVFSNNSHREESVIKLPHF